jgi:hypothetical protein
MLHSLYPEGMFLDLPWAVPHLPATQRQWRPETASTPPSQGISEFSADMLFFNNNSNWSNNPSERLQLIAQFFNAMGQMSDQALTDNLAQQTLQMRSAHISRMTEVLEDSPQAPDYWHQDLQKIINSNEQSLLSSLPAGFNGLPGEAAGQRLLAKQLWRSFSQGIRAWEACITQATLLLRS